MANEKMDDRVHATLVAIGLDSGLTPTDANKWADSRMTSTQAAGIRLGLAVEDMRRQLVPAAERAGAQFARAIRSMRRSA